MDKLLPAMQIENYPETHFAKGNCCLQEQEELISIDATATIVGHFANHNLIFFSGNSPSLALFGACIYIVYNV